MWLQRGHSTRTWAEQWTKSNYRLLALRSPPCSARVSVSSSRAQPCARAVGDRSSLPSLPLRQFGAGRVRCPPRRVRIDAWRHDERSPSPRPHLQPQQPHHTHGFAVSHAHQPPLLALPPLRRRTMNHPPLLLGDPAPGPGWWLTNCQSNEQAVRPTNADWTFRIRPHRSALCQQSQQSARPAPNATATIASLVCQVLPYAPAQRVYQVHAWTWSSSMLSPNRNLTSQSQRAYACCCEPANLTQTAAKNSVRFLRKSLESPGRGRLVGLGSRRVAAAIGAAACRVPPRHTRRGLCVFVIPAPS